LTSSSKGKTKALEFKVPKVKKVTKASLANVKSAKDAVEGEKLTVTETVKYAGQTIEYVSCRSVESFCFSRGLESALFLAG
jgi:hypothetical protein